jgi:fluoride exporter
VSIAATSGVLGIRARRSDHGFTTFSTFSVQVVLDADAGEPGKALAYVLASVIGGVAAAAAGYALGRRLA